MFRYVFAEAGVPGASFSRIHRKLITAKVVGIFIIVCVGYVVTKLGVVPVSATRYLSSIVINIAAPCIVILTLSEAELSRERLASVAAMFVIAAAGVACSWAISLLFNRTLKVLPSERGVFSNNLMFTNFGFMGYSVALSAFGREGLFLMVMLGVVQSTCIYTIGMAHFKKDAAAITGIVPHRSSAAANVKEVLNPPIIGTLIGLAFYFFRIPMPEAAAEVLSSIGAMMTPLAMMVIGMQLTESDPRAIIRNKQLIVAVIMRLVVIPGLFFIIMYLCGLPWLWLAVAALSFLLPSATVLAPLAQQYGANAQRTAELIFLTTLFSIITIPVSTVLLHTL